MVAGWGDGCLDIDDTATFSNINSGAVNDTSIVDLQIDATYFSCDTPFVSGDVTGEPALNGSTFPGIETGTSSLTVPTGFSAAIVNGDNENNVTVFDPTDPLIDAPLEAVTAIGADGQGNDWYRNWTLPGSF